MATRLKAYSPQRILDIGCGDGSGLLAILSILNSEEITILSLEENLECINITAQNLRSKGLKVSIINRMHVIPKTNNKYLLGVESGKLFETSSINLIESDILLSDDDLLSFLMSIQCFDAITIWLIGTHHLRNECENLFNLKIKSSFDYRLRVQNQVYVLADKLLRSGGVLQIIDRGEVPDTKLLREGILNAHKEQASVTDFEVSSLDYMIYDEPNVSQKITMQPSIGSSGRNPDLSRTAMICIESIKP